VSPEKAEILGLEALTWLVSDPAGIERFLAASGVSGAELREAVGSPDFAGAVLDFLLAHEDLLADFCQTTGTRAADLHRARHLLQPEV
jgi:hypothetical protein